MLLALLLVAVLYGAASTCFVFKYLWESRALRDTLAMERNLVAAATARDNALLERLQAQVEELKASERKLMDALLLASRGIYTNLGAPETEMEDSRVWTIGEDEEEIAIEEQRERELAEARERKEALQQDAVDAYLDSYGS